MIGKLIKHDLKAGARQMSRIYFAALIACVAMIFSSFTKSGFLRILSFGAVAVIAAIAIIITFVSVVFGANKTLFGREGYLTQTLPVRTSSLIFSKWLTSSFWVIVGFTFFAVVLVSIVAYLTTGDQEGVEFYEIVTMVLQQFGIGVDKVSKTIFIIKSMIGLFTACIFVMWILFAITLSNIRPFHKLGSFGIIIYLALTIFIVQGASNGLEKLCDITLVVAESGMTMTVDMAAVHSAVVNGTAIGFTSVYFKIIVTIFLYIITVQLTESKINLK